MTNQHIIDCYKLDFIKNIPEELELTIEQRDDLLKENIQLKNIIRALGISIGCLFVYTLFKHYEKKRKNEEKRYLTKETESMD